MTIVTSSESLLRALAGGALIGVAASMLLMLNGRIAGISGILCDVFSRQRSAVSWRALFLAGLLVGGACFAWFDPQALANEVPLPIAATILAGLLVGVGTRVGGGCTSGHGVCGVSRLSLRSIAATCTFVFAGMLTVFVVRHAAQGGSGASARPVLPQHALATPLATEAP